MRPSPLSRAAALHARAINLRDQGKLRPAETACRKAARLFERAAGPDSADAAHAEVEAAEMAELRGDPPGAGALLARAIRRLAAAASDDETPEDILQLYLRARVGLARVEQMRGRYPAAERTCRATLRWARTHPGPHRKHMSAALNGLGVYLKARGRYAEALALYRRALQIVRAQPGSKAETLATLYHNLAGSEHARGRPAAAVIHARRGLRLRRRAAGPDDPSTIADEAALAPILDDLGKRTEAERLYQRALRYYLRHFGSAATRCRSRWPTSAPSTTTWTICPAPSSISGGPWA